MESSKANYHHLDTYQTDRPTRERHPSQQPQNPTSGDPQLKRRPPQQKHPWMRGTAPQQKHPKLETHPKVDILTRLQQPHPQQQQQQQHSSNSCKAPRRPNSNREQMCFN